MIANRRHKRVPVVIPAEVASEKVKIRNLSRGGAFVHGLAAGNVNEKVKVPLGGVKVDAEIRWVRGSGVYGFGVQFALELTQEEFKKLVGEV